MMACLLRAFVLNNGQQRSCACLVWDSNNVLATSTVASDGLCFEDIY